MRRLSARAIVPLVAVVTVGSVNLAMAAGVRSASDYSLSTGPTYQLSGDRIHQYVSETFTLVNANLRRVLVRTIGQNGPGLQLRVLTGSGTTQKLIPRRGPGTMYAVPPHESIRLRVWYHVTDCAAVPKGRWPLTMDVAWRSGKWQRVTLQMPRGLVAPWPRSMTDFVCP